jgi:hypothetical protein
VLTAYFRPSDALRLRELDLCLRLNAANPYVTAVHLLLEHAAHDPRPRLPAALAAKMRVWVVGRRPTFSDAFSYANERLHGHVCILANGDVFTDHSLARLYPPAAVRLENKVRGPPRASTVLC